MTTRDKSFPKRVGMVHIKGVNDEQYKAYIEKVNSKPKTSNHLWLQLP